jgi:glutamine amidotransferase-like uncharacterized protein
MVRNRRQLAIASLASLTSLFLAACQRPDAHAPDILLFDGKGASSGDVRALERILKQHGLAYARANSGQLDAMSEAELRGYRLLIIPGGNFERIGNGLTPGATQKVRASVRGGLNYLGVCAGGFFAGASPYNGLDLVEGVRFNFYALEDQGVRKAVVPIAVAGAPAADHYWEDGPQFSGWGEVIAKYPDGSPAAVQGHVGEGWIVLAGFHPEAPASWRGAMTFTTPLAADQAYAAALIEAALNRTRLAHY